MAGSGNSLILHGNYETTLDDKCRIVLPAVFRRKMNTDILYVTEGEDCLIIYPPSKFEEIVNELEEHSDTYSTDDNDLIRDRVGSCHEADIDKSGRLVIFESLREYAGITKECVVVGMIKYLELWDKEKYLINKRKSRENKKAIEDMSRRIKHKKGVIA